MSSIHASSQAILSVENVYKEYALNNTKPVQVLENVSCQANQGETVAIVGHSGSGKSTLLSLIAGLDSPTRGKILLSGEALADMSEDEITRFRADNIGIIFQQFHLMPYLNAEENVSLPLEILKKKNIGKTVRKSLDAVGLSKRRHHFPDQMSGGENQRVAIARALVTNPKLLIADEPTGNLDAKSSDTVTKLIFSLVKELRMTLVMATHNLEIAARCDRTLSMRGGKLS